MSKNLKVDNVLMRIWGYKKPYILRDVDGISYSGEQFDTTPFTW